MRSLLLFEKEADLCVCELGFALDISQPKISRHLAAMRDAGILKSRRQAQWVFYSLNDRMADWQRDIVHAAIRGNREEAIARADRLRLDEMKDRPARCEVA